MKTFLLVITMWGQSADGNWNYIGNQYVLNQEFSLDQCEQLAANASWSEWRSNEYYDIQFECHEKKH